MKFSIATLATLLLQSASLAQANRGVRGERKLRPLEETCLATVGVLEDGDDSKFLDCETPSGMHYTVPVTATWINENMANGLLNSGRTELDMPGAVVNHETGEIVLPNGHTPPGLVNNPNKGPNRQRHLATTGPKTVLVVRVVASDGSTTANEAKLSDSVFGTNGDPVNLSSQYSACSHGQLTFNQASPRSKLNDGNSITTDIALGATTVNIATSTSEGDVPMRNAITNQLNAQFGVTSPTELANHVMYCLPTGTMSGIAYAFINSWMSVYSDNWCTYVSGQVHELGHNINLAHSNENGAAYNDQTGLMGFSYGQSDTRMCFNGAKFWQLGWFTGDDALEVVEGDLPLTITLEAFTSGLSPSDGKPKVVKIQHDLSTDMYMVFNRKNLHNADTREAGDLVTIVEQGSEGTGYSQSSLLAKLGGTNSFTSTAYFGDRDVTVTVESIDLTTNEATVTITASSQCETDADCTDNLVCNGVETCSAGTCVAGTPITCTATSTCGKPQVCSEPLGTCVDDGSGEDGVCAGNENCSICPGDCGECECESDSDCDNGNACDGVETCSSSFTCVAGTPITCGFSECGKAMVCSAPTGTCVDDGDGQDGFCDLSAGESCLKCSGDCEGSFFDGASVCGNGMCESGENCNNCPSDCAGKTNGNPSQRFCCAGGAGGCTDSRCIGSCTTDEPIEVITCCGDNQCQGDEAITCPSDCTGGPTPPAPTPPAPTPPAPTPPAPTPPAPTPPAPTPPAPSPNCPICEATGQECCGTCISNGKPSGRGCF